MNSYRIALLCSTLGSAIVVAGTLSCSGGEETAAYTITDSAGVDVVMNVGPQWQDGAGWSVDPEPYLTIGTATGDPEYELYNVTGAVRLPDGQIAVLNSGSHEIRFYDGNGQHLRSVGGEGGGPGKFQNPYDLYSLAGDSVVVYDVLQRRLSFFDRDGEYVRSFTLPVNDKRYRAVDFFPDGAVLVQGRIPSEGGRQSGPYRDESLFVVFNLEGDSVATLGAFENREMYARTEGGFLGITGRVFGRTTVVATRGSTLFIGTNDGYVIDQYERDGRLIRSIRRDIAVPVTDEMFAAEIEVQLERMDPGPIRDMMAPAIQEMPQPDVLPHYSALETDPDGNLWVRHYHSASIPSFEWTVFDSTGHMLGDMTLPEGLDVYEIGRDYVLGRWRDEAGVEYVRLHRLSK
jgi:hypothetical protein